MKQVCAYCRVSTDKDDQVNSLENQKNFFENYINRNPEWDLVKIYADEGISGTSVKGRKAFNQMIQDAENREFDLILTKEISRFARNTLDSIYYTRKLKDLGIGVFFLNDNINTLDPDSELRLTIMSSIAQEESRKTSDRVKWGQRRQMEKGIVFGGRFFGYYVKDGKLCVNPHEAETVKLIFDLYLEGMGSSAIAKELENRGILSPSGSYIWQNPTILGMLKNEKYIGVLKQKKKVTANYLTHKRVKNDTSDYVIIENNHEPIIADTTFESVQKEIAKRQTVKFDRGRHSNRYIWSGKVICGYCNAKFKRRIRNKKISPLTIWQCSTYIKYGSRKLNNQNIYVGCDGKCVHEAYLQHILMETISSLRYEKDRILITIKNTLREVLNVEPKGDTQETLADIAKIEKQKEKLIELFYEDSITKEDLKKSNDKLTRQLEALQTKLTGIEKSNNISKKLQEVFNAAETILDEFVNKDIFSDEIAKQFLNKIIIYGREKLDIYINVNGKYPLNFIFPFCTPTTY